MDEADELDEILIVIALEVEVIDETVELEQILKYISDKTQIHEQSCVPSESDDVVDVYELDIAALHDYHEQIEKNEALFLVRYLDKR